MSIDDCCKANASECDVISRALCKVGIKRSMLWTLALIPFAWDGVVWVAEAIKEVWNMVSGVGA